MNTVEHEVTTVRKHEIRMNYPVTARDIRDFILQVDRIFEDVIGAPVEFDDAYIVTGDEDGLVAEFEVEDLA